MAVKNFVKQNRRKVGRPPTVEAEKAIGIRLPGRLLDAVDGWGEANEVSRSEAIRRLLERGLAAEAADKVKPRRAKPKPD
jgi:hypothetical protein